MMKQMSVFTAAVILTACSAGEAPLLTNEPVLGAALANPCADQFAFQQDLNGAPDDVYSETNLVQGKNVTKQEYWYADTSMVVYFTYAVGERWCNVWNEGGVVWDR